MYKILQATCNNGNLVLDEKLSNEWEGKSFQVIVFETDEIEVNKKRFFDFVDRYSFTLPDDYQFNREELYERSRAVFLSHRQFIVQN